jgi:predicted dehydrogenase
VDAARWGLQAGALEVVEASGDVRDGVDVRATARLRAAGPDRHADSRTDGHDDGQTERDTARGGETPVADVRCGIRGRDEQLVAVYGDEAALVLGGASFGTKDVPCSLHLLRGTQEPGDAGAPVERTVEEFPAVDPYRLMVEAVAAAVRGEDVWLPTAQDSLDIAATTDQVRARLLAAAHAR